jgi:hypothetical protein
MRVATACNRRSIKWAAHDYLHGIVIDLALIVPMTSGTRAGTVANGILPSPSAGARVNLAALFRDP